MIKMGHIHPNAFRNILIIYPRLNPCWTEFVSKNVKFSKVWDFSRLKLFENRLFHKVLICYDPGVYII